MEQHDKQEEAKKLYLHTDKTLQEIADFLEVNRKTLYRWIKLGRWDKMKKAAAQAPDIMIHNIHDYIFMIDKKIRKQPEEDQCPNINDVNMIFRLLKCTNLIDRQHTGAYMQAYEELLKFLTGEDRELAHKVYKVSDRYITGFLDKTKDPLSELEKLNIKDVRENLKHQDEERKREMAEEETSDSGIAELPKTNKSDAPKHTNAERPDNFGRAQMGHEWGTDGASVSEAKKTAKPATDNNYKENVNVPMPQNAPQKNNSENGTFSQSLEKEEIKKDAAYYATLPPDQRPSPFREGNIIWVNHRDDISDDDRKMGERVQLYPDMDEYNKFAERAYKLRMESEAKDKEEKEKAKAIRDAEMNKLMNMDIYKHYKHHLQPPCDNIYEKVIVHGMKVNKMWFQHNLAQMPLPENERKLVNESEFLRAHAIEATLRYMRMTG